MFWDDFFVIVVVIFVSGQNHSLIFTFMLNEMKQMDGILTELSMIFFR